jgi:hypothetical protein
MYLFSAIQYRSIVQYYLCYAVLEKSEKSADIYEDAAGMVDVHDSHSLAY